MSPKISVVVCTYNRAGLLEDCLKSLAKQSADISGYEIIVVDNNSTDKTKEVANSFIKKYPNFRYVKEPNQGLSHARNRGWKEARGEYAAYIDDDARADGRWVENIIAFASKHPDVVAFGGPYKGFSLEEIPEWYKETTYGTKTLGEKQRPIDKNEWISGTNMVFRKTLLSGLGGFNTRVGMSKDTVSYGEETNLLVKIKKKNLPIFYVPDMVVEHLVADYKMSLRWMLMSHYKNGFSAMEAFELRRRPFRQALVTLYCLLNGFIRFIFSKKRYFRARVLESFSVFVWNLGLTVRMFKGE